MKYKHEIIQGFIAISLVLAVFVLANFLSARLKIALGAPSQFISTPATSTPAENFSFTIGTSSPRGVFGTTTLAVYGSTTIQTAMNNPFAFNILNAATSSVFRVDTSGGLIVVGGTGTSTFAGGITLTGGCFRIHGACLEAGGAGSPFAWTPTSAGNSTSTTLIFGNGFVSQASSTIIGGLNLQTALSVANGGTGVTTLSSGLPLIGAGTGAITSSSTLSVFVGGTGASSFTAGTVIVGNGNGALLASSTIGTNLISDAYLFNTGDTGTGVYDFGGASSFEIPNAAAPTVDADGETAVDTTSGQFKWFTTGPGTQVLTGTSSPSFNIASSTLDNSGKQFGKATSTFLIKNNPEAFTLVGFYCKATTTAASSIIGFVRFGDGTDWTTEGTCNTTGGFTLTPTNNTFTRFEDFIVEASSTGGTAAGTALQRMTITTITNKTAD